MAEETKKVPSSEKTANLKKTLDALNVKNAQAMKLLDEKYAVKNDVGRKAQYCSGLRGARPRTARQFTRHEDA